MSRALLILLLLTGLTAYTPRARAFSLLGEIPSWFTDNTGQVPNGVDIYGPVNLGEEYRWVTPTLFYAFDESFLNYFGQRGVEEVQKAIKILNDLPKMSEVNLSDYPMHSQRVNYRARDLTLLDLKSYTLKMLLEEMGLGTPGRFVFTLRARNPQSTPPITNYMVIQRNFDPETWMPTPYINGQLWTYTRIYDNQDSQTVKASTVPVPVDPLVLAEPVAALVPSFSFTVFSYGSYITGLTRDDVGGLRYIYRPDNKNVETLPADALTGGTGAGVSGGGTTVIGGGSSGGEGNWIPVQGTNAASGVADGKAGEWVPIQAPSTNNTATGGTGTGTTGGNVPISQALRGGIDKLSFTLGPPVYVPGAYSLAHRYKETVIVVTNGISRSVQQQITRILTAPDILFSAEDLVNADATYRTARRTDVATSNDGINGQAITLDGPGQFGGATMNISFNKMGPVLLNSAPTTLGQGNGFEGFVWGSFDGTTNDPAIYPTGTSIKDLERAVFGSR